MPSKPQVYDPNQPVSANNPLPSQQISSISTIGVPAGVTYQRTPYSQPGVSALVGFAPEGITPGTSPDNVPVSVIVRQG